jgi:Protein kinase domain/NACHT domain
MLAAGADIGGFVVERVLGRGGMGVVYEAYQPQLQRQVALKLVHPELAADPLFKARFRREAVAQAAVTHPHILPVYEIGECSDGLYLAMQLVHGPTLKELIAAHALTPSDSVALLAPIAAAIDAAHAEGLIHRDVKPENILVSAESHPFLTDFGITKALGGPTVTGGRGFIGTPAYAAPEQLTGEATAGSDIYALGATLYECLTGRPPFPGASRTDVVHAHLDRRPPRASALRGALPAGVDTVIERALAKDPRDRPPTASALLADAARALRGEALGPAQATTEAGPAAPRPTPAASGRPGRDALLRRVVQSYRAFLEQTLGVGFRLDVPLHLAPALTRPPRDRLLPRPRPHGELAAGTSIHDVFEDAGGIRGDGLLVVGAPGAGKTTAVVELAATLAERAGLDPAEPVPLYVPLASFTVSRGGFEPWLVEQVNRLYKTSPAAVRRLLDHADPSAVLVLDGLDEIADYDAREACAEAINLFAASYPLATIVTARRAEYEALDLRLELETAVMIAPLSPDLVLARLHERPETRGVVAVIERDPALRELLTSPLLVGMLTIAYRDRAPAEIPLTRESSTEPTLIDAFVERQFALQESAHGSAYPLDRTRYWLSALAAGLAAHHQTIFLLERLRPALLPSRTAVRLAQIAPKAVYGLLAGLIVFVVSARLSRELGFRELPAAHIAIWLVFGVYAGLIERLRMRARIPAWIVLGFACGVPYRLLLGVHDVSGYVYQSLYHATFFTLVGELLIRLLPPDLEPAERLSWSWRRARPHVLPAVVVGVAAGPVFGLLLRKTLESQGGSVGGQAAWSLVFGCFSGLLWGLCRGIGRALMPAPNAAHNRPNEGIRYSARYAALVCAVTFLAIAGATGAGVLVWSLAAAPSDVATVLWLAGAWACGSACLLAMACGGGAVVQHWAIRVLLWRCGLAPRRLTRWLAFAVRLRVLYWGVGGGYMFIHPRVQEHFSRVERSASPG